MFIVFISSLWCNFEGIHAEFASFFLISPRSVAIGINEWDDI